MKRTNNERENTKTDVHPCFSFQSAFLGDDGCERATALCRALLFQRMAYCFRWQTKVVKKWVERCVRNSTAGETIIIWLGEKRHCEWNKNKIPSTWITRTVFESSNERALSTMLLRFSRRVRLRFSTIRSTSSSRLRSSSSLNRSSCVMVEWYM